MNWLHSQNGPFRDFLKGILQPSYFSTLGSIDDRLRSLRRGWRSLVAHANYLSDLQVRFVAENAQTMAIVHCPRTHAFFQHQHADGPTYPLAKRLAQGAVHFLGTDSRASNPDLNLWTEAQTLRAAHPSVPSHQILSMITCDSAAFLCIPDADYGALRIASPAALTAIDLEPSNPSKSESSIEAIIPPSDLTPDQLYDRILDRHTKSMPIEATIAASL
jgi:predicted amidohydrolase YtcJ